jgi:fructokinase
MNCEISDLPGVSDDHEIWSRIGYYLANLCLNITLLCSVEAIVLGGGVMNRQILYPIIRSELKKLLNNYVQADKLMGDLTDYIKSPGLGSDVGIIGAFLLE